MHLPIPVAGLPALWGVVSQREEGIKDMIPNYIRIYEIVDESEGHLNDITDQFFINEVKFLINKPIRSSKSIQFSPLLQR